MIVEGSSYPALDGLDELLFGCSGKEVVEFCPMGWRADTLVEWDGGSLESGHEVGGGGGGGSGGGAGGGRGVASRHGDNG